MNKKQLSRLMHARGVPLRSFAGYFFRADFEYVLRGVVFEYVPRGVYIWDFWFPLFDFFGPNLLYSTRLSNRGGFIEKGSMSEENIVDTVMCSHEARSAFAPSQPVDVSEFVRFLESRPDILRNGHAKLIYAAALILNGQEVRAIELLDQLAPMLNEKDLASCNLLRIALEQSPEAVRAVLNQVRAENLRKLGIVL
jgi:hypothetical protein